MCDYYQDEGCCLTCEDAEPGCLCFNCKCTKCVYYNEGGFCNIAESSRIEAKKRRKSISEWAKKRNVDYTKVGLHKNQTILEVK
uniref:Uncharacterized protein n=1 Tax=viral metagenome TaxID=1070528 RepID=A0A6H1ZYD9_9ZZZZ